MKKIIMLIFNVAVHFSVYAILPADTNGDGKVTTDDVDFIYDYHSIEPWTIETIAGYKAYWGQGIEEPKVVIENVPVRADNTQLMKGKTLKIQLPDNLSAVKFFSNADEYNSLVSEQGCTRINLVGTCDINTWNYTPQIKIIDYEITQKFEYYF